MKRIAIIPARGGSKRIPNKNIKDFFGKPIIAYSIEAAIVSGMYDEIMVSTDSESIKEVALQFGAKVPFLRSAQNSNDFATTVDVLLEVLSWYKKKGIHFEAATCIYACAPFTSAALLKESFNILDKGCDCVYPVLPYSHPIQRAVKLSEENFVKPFFDTDATARTQDFNKAFHDAGMFYSFSVERLLVTKSLRTDNTVALLIDELCAQDIDSENDWQLAELKYKLFFK